MSSDQEIIRQGQISKFGNAYHRLSRPYFSVIDDNQALDKIEVRCDMKFTRMPVHNRVVLNIPEAWGNCGLTLYGKEGSQFLISEFKSTPEA